MKYGNLFDRTFGKRGVTARFSAERIDKGLERIRKVLDSIETDKSYAKAGVMGRKAVAPRPVDADGEGPLTNVQLALIHEFGAPSKGIPERSFIRAPFQKHREEYLETLRKLVKASVYEGQITYMHALKIMGLKMATDMKKFVMSGDEVPPPNAPATLARKRAKGLWKLKKARQAAAKKWSANGCQGDPFADMKPQGEPRTLVDTGRMAGSITWGVVAKTSEDKGPE